MAAVHKSRDEGLPPYVTKDNSNSSEENKEKSSFFVTESETADYWRERDGEAFGGNNACFVGSNMAVVVVVYSQIRRREKKDRTEREREMNVRARKRRKEEREKRGEGRRHNGKREEKDEKKRER
ncbi:hypothetical protein WMY93_021748 [Mugilogobius chulae]|uniref:Uncharacterized protein n=1 Tax=Mugilogobius chulae TaxID=88201 RepID=A0AAW0NBR1_9GOBI